MAPNRASPRAFGCFFTGSASDFPEASEASTGSMHDARSLPDEFTGTKKLRLKAVEEPSLKEPFVILIGSFIHHNSREPQGE